MALQITKSVIYMGGTGTGASATQPVDMYFITADDRNAYNLNNLYNVLVAHADFIGNTTGTTVTPGGTNRGNRVFNITHLGNTHTRSNLDTVIGGNNIGVDDGSGFNTSSGYAFYGEFGDAFSYNSRTGNVFSSVNFTNASIPTFANGRTTRLVVANDEFIHQFDRPAIINCAFRLEDTRVGHNEINFYGDSRIWLNLLGGGTDTVTTAANGAYTSGTTFTVDNALHFYDPPAGETATANILNSSGAVIDTFTYTGFNATNTQFTGVSDLGAVADNAVVSQNDRRAQVTLGLEVFDAVTGTVEINYQQPPSNVQVRPWDFRNNTNNEANHIEYYILGRSHGSVNMPNNEAPVVTINCRATAGWQRFDNDFGPGEVSGTVSVAFNVWAGSTSNRVHSGVGAGVTFSQGSQVYGQSNTLGAELRPEVSATSDATIGSTAYNWPDTYLTSTQLSNTNQHNILYPASGASRLWTIYNYPYTGYGLSRLGFSSNSASGYQGCNYYIDPSTPTPQNITQQGSRFHGVNSNIIFSSSYQPRFLRADETEADDGAVIRIRNNNLPLFTGTNEVFDPTSTQYTSQPRDFNNIELEAYGYRIDKSSGGGNRNGYLLHWAISANSNIGTSTPSRALLRHYSGDFDVIHAGPGMESVTLTKDPSPTTGQVDRNVVDTIVADPIPGYSDSNRTAAPIEYGQATSSPRIDVSGGTTAISAISGSTVTVTSIASFFPGATGGEFYVGNSKYTYSGVSGNNLTGVSPTTGLSVGTTISNFELRSWSTVGAAINADQFASSMISFPWQFTVDYSGLSNSSKNTNMPRYVQMWEGVGDYDGNLISLSGSTIAVKNKSALHPSRITYGTGFIPTKGTTYDEIYCNSNGWTDLNSQQLDCTAAGSNHVFVSGRVNNLFTTTTFPTLNQYAMRGNTRMSGVHSVSRPASGDTYLQYIDCDRDGSFSVSGTAASGHTGNVRVIGAPDGTNFSPSWVVPVTTLTITTPALMREARSLTTVSFNDDTQFTLASTDGFNQNGGIAFVNGNQFTYTGITGNILTGVSGVSGAFAVGSRVNNGIGRLSLYTSAGALIGDFTSASTSGLTIDNTTGEITYVFSSTSHPSLPAPSGSSPPTVTAVWSGPGGTDTRFTISLSGSGLTQMFIRAQANESTATRLPTGYSVNYSASGISSGVLTWRISGARGGSIPSTAQTWYFQDNNLKGSALYNSFIQGDADRLNAMTNNSHYSQVNGDLIRMTPQESNTQTVGFIENLSETDPVTDIGVPNGSFDFNIAADPPGINPLIIQEALIAFNAATQQDVNNARNVVLGNL